MTRETKIGLLVGLAFIIVIGILLSDYNRIENPQAQLFVAGPNVQAGVSSPRSDAPTQTTIVYPSAPVSPRQPVPTKAELSQRGGGSAVVVVHDNGQLNGRPVPDDQGQQNVVVVHGHKASDPIQGNDGQQDLKTIVKVHNEELVAVSPYNGQSGNKNTAPQAGKQYTAEAGDTVSKMAGRFMGGNTKTNRDAIVKANPSLQANINNVVVGKVYVIPALVAASTSAQLAPSAPKQPMVQAPVNQPPQVPTHWYVVKESDSLWRIAQDQVGDPNAVAVIKELNKDVLKGRDEIHPNMRLRLPAKPLASAN